MTAIVYKPSKFCLLIDFYMQVALIRGVILPDVSCYRFVDGHYQDFAAIHSAYILYGICYIEWCRMDSNIFFISEELMVKFQMKYL